MILLRLVIIKPFHIPTNAIKTNKLTYLEFCSNDSLHQKVLSAYNHLWDVIDNNRDQLSGEVWSWQYDNGFKVVPFDALSTTESDIRQLWSLTFLAVQRQSFN